MTSEQITTCLLHYAPFDIVEIGNINLTAATRHTYDATCQATFDIGSISFGKIGVVETTLA